MWYACCVAEKLARIGAAVSQTPAAFADKYVVPPAPVTVVSFACTVLMKQDAWPVLDL